MSVNFSSKLQMKCMALAGVLAAVSATPAMAQSALTPHQKKLVMLQKVNSLNASMMRSAKTASVGYRVIGTKSIVTDGIYIEPLDSMRFTYSGSRGDLNFMMLLDIDESAYLTVPGCDLSQSFEYDDTNGSWSVVEDYTQTYDALSNTLTSTSRAEDAGTLENDSKRLYTYNSQQRMTDMADQVWTGVGWQTDSRYEFKYNAAGKNDTIRNYILGTAGMGDYRGGAYYEFNASNQKIKRTDYEIDNNGVKQLSARVTYTYTNGDLSEALAEGYSNGNWIPQEKNIYTNNASHQRITDKFQYWDSFSGSWKDDGELTYVWANGRIDSVKSPFTQGADMLSKIYYESFTLGLTQQQLTNAEVKVYPNPAQNNVTIQAKLQSAENVTLSLYNVTGVKVWSKELGSQQNIREQIDLSGLSNGLYQLQIATPSGVSSQKVSVIK